MRPCRSLLLFLVFIWDGRVEAVEYPPERGTVQASVDGICLHAFRVPNTVVHVELLRRYQCFTDLNRWTPQSDSMK